MQITCSYREEQEQSQGRDCNSAGLEGTDDTFDELAEEMELMTIDKVIEVKRRYVLKSTCFLLILIA